MTLSIKDIFPDLGGGSSGPTTTDPYAAQKKFNIYGANFYPVDIPNSNFWTNTQNGISTISINFSSVVDVVNNCLTQPLSASIAYLSYIGAFCDELNLGNQFTIEAVIKSSAWYVGSSYFSTVICAKKDTSGTNYELGLYNSTIVFYYANYTGMNSWSFTPTNGVSYYIVLQRDGSNITCYVNGTSLGTQTLSGTISGGASKFSLLGDGTNYTNPSSMYAFRLTNALRPITSTYTTYTTTFLNNSTSNDC
jgi:hypothetical protein